MSKDSIIHKQESEAKRQKKKSSKPQDNYADKYVTGLEKMRTQGKGDKLRDADSKWYSAEVTERLNKIFKKDAKKKAKK